MTAALRRRLVAALKLALGLAALAAVLWWLVPGPDEAQAVWARAELRPGWLLAGLGFTFVACVVTSARWKRMAEAMGGTRLPHVAYFHSLALTKVLGQVSSTLVMDLVGRGVALRAAGSQRGLGHAITQAVLERIFDLVLPLMLLAWALAVWWGGLGGAAALASFAAVCGLFVALSGVMLAPLTGLALRVYAALGRARARLAGGAEVAALEVPAVERRVALDIALLGLARYLAVLGQFWAVAAAVGADIALEAMAGATPIGQLSGMLGVTPGALGIQEAGWAGALRWVGVSAETIALFVLSQRLVITAYFAVLALGSRFLLGRRAA